MAVLYPLRFGTKDPLSPQVQLFPMGFGEVASTFGGITGMYPISNGRFRLTWGAAAGTLYGYRIYIKSSATVFTGGTIVAIAPPTWTCFDINLSAEDTPFVDGVVWYCGIRALSTAGTEDSNTAELNTSAFGASKTIRISQAPGAGSVG